MTQCEVCDGTGQIVERNIFSRTHEIKECKHCNGTGEVIAIGS